MKNHLLLISNERDKLATRSRHRLPCAHSCERSVSVPCLKYAARESLELRGVVTDVALSQRKLNVETRSPNGKRGKVDKARARAWAQDARQRCHQLNQRFQRRDGQISPIPSPVLSITLVHPVNRTISKINTNHQFKTSITIYKKKKFQKYKKK